MTYDQLVQYYQANVPQDPAAALGTPAGDARFNSWTSQLEQQLGIPGGSYNDPSSGWAAIQPAQLDQFEVQGGGGTPATNQPAEQAIFNVAAPGLAAAVSGDAARQQQVQQLTNQTNAAYGNLGAVLGQAASTFDGQAYFAANPSVAAQFNALPAGTAPGTKSLNGQDVTPSQFAQQSWQTVGQAAGIAPTYTSQLVQGQNANVDTTTAAITAAAQQSAQSQLTALQSSISQMQGNLTGDLATKAAALQTAVTSFNQNLDTLDATQKQALATQIASQQADLEQSIASQKQALSTEVQQLQGDSSAAAQQRTAALNTEIAGLNAAEVPMAQARTQGAEALTTAVNLGLQSTEQQLKANAAQQGFVGGSTMQDASLARAVVDARQQAAQAGANANIANATDTQNIANAGATGAYNIADTLAGQQQNISDQGAQGNAQLGAALAQGQQALGDTGATGLAAITANTAGARSTIGNQAASQAYSDTTTGADQNLALQNNLSTGTYNLSQVLAQQQQQAANTAANAKAGNYANLFPAAVNAAQVATALPANQAASLTALLPYGNAGLTNTQNALNWWAAPASPAAPATAITQPSTAGNQISSLGNSLVGSAFNLGNANQWWQTPTTTTGSGGAPGPSSVNGVTTTLGATVCWISRAAFGADNPRWIKFREWMLTKAPGPLLEVYLKFGPAIAKRIEDRPYRRAQYRRVMDSILNEAFV